MQQTPDYDHLQKLAQSPAGKQLITSLQRSGGKQLEEALSQASQGDFTSAQRVLSRLLSSPEAQALLKQLEGST